MIDREMEALIRQHDHTLPYCRHYLRNPEGPADHACCQPTGHTGDHMCNCGCTWPGKPAAKPLFTRPVVPQHTVTPISQSKLWGQR